MFALLGKLFGQDLTKTSLPVILGEPLSTLQKCAENYLIQEEYIAKAARTNDSLLRMAYTIGHFLSQMIITKNKTKKPFNPMLGETYELVTEDFRFIAEQVSHHPPVSVYHCEGKNYSFRGSYDTKSQFGIGGGKGLMIVSLFGHQDYSFETYNDVISINRPRVYVQNLVFGEMYVDFDGLVTCINHQTGDKAEFMCYPRGWTTESRIEGKIMDSTGKERIKIEGNWQERVMAKDLRNGTEFEICGDYPKIPESSRQFNFNQLAVNLNYVNEQMLRILPPTDTRRRGDQRFYEEGKVDEADEEKIRLEVKQRKARKIREDSGGVWTPNFFRKIDHPFIPGEHIWEFIEERNYWQRRKN